MSHHPKSPAVRITMSHDRLRYDDPGAEAAGRKSHRAAIMLREKQRELRLAVGTPSFDRAQAEFVAARKHALDKAMECVPEFERSVREREEEACMAPRGPARDRANAVLALARSGLSAAVLQVRILKGEASSEETCACRQLRPASFVVVVPKSGGSNQGEEDN
jgi:hypothetical protein